MVNSCALESVQAYINTSIGSDPSDWVKPGLYVGEIEAALLDSILSVQTRYGNSPDTGVRKRVTNWRKHRTQHADEHIALDDLNVLAAFSVEGRDSELANILDCRQTLSGPGRTRPLKALAIAQVAAAFVQAGVSSHDGFDANDQQQKKLWLGIGGLGFATWHYTGMLLGHPSVKADTMICRFVATALGTKSVKPKTAMELLLAASRELGVRPEVLDHAIWRWQRSQ